MEMEKKKVLKNTKYENQTSTRRCQWIAFAFQNAQNNELADIIFYISKLFNIKLLNLKRIAFLFIFILFECIVCCGEKPPSLNIMLKH